MGVFWLAVDRDCSSYLELKYRKVAAQGWSALGDLVSLKPFYPNHEELFKQNIKALGDIGCGNKTWWHRDECPSIIWNLMSLKKGDLIVALEGTTVKGICKMPSDSLTSYRFDKGFEYAHTVGFGVKWIDIDFLEFTPTPPSKGVLGIKNLNNERNEVIKAWEEANNPE